MWTMEILFFFFQAEDGIRDLVRSRGLGDVYKRQGRGNDGLGDDRRRDHGRGRRGGGGLRGAPVLDPVGAAVLEAPIGPLSAPVLGPGGERDRRRVQVRRGPALVEVCRRATRSGPRPPPGAIGSLRRPPFRGWRLGGGQSPPLRLPGLRARADPRLRRRRGLHRLHGRGHGALRRCGHGRRRGAGLDGAGGERAPAAGRACGGESGGRRPGRAVCV